MVKLRRRIYNPRGINLAWARWVKLQTDDVSAAWRQKWENKTLLFSQNRGVFIQFSAKYLALDPRNNIYEPCIFMMNEQKHEIIDNANYHAKIQKNMISYNHEIYGDGKQKICKRLMAAVSGEVAAWYPKLGSIGPLIASTRNTKEVIERAMRTKSKDTILISATIPKDTIHPNLNPKSVTLQ